MILSRSSGSRGGSLKLDLTYAIIRTFWGEERRLYIESIFIKTVTPVEGSKNSPVYGKEGDLSSLFLEEYDTILEETPVHLTMQWEHLDIDENKVWKLYFDEPNSKEGNGARVLLVSPEDRLIPLSFKLEFEATNNMEEYEALLLGLQTIGNMNIEFLTMYGYFELIVKKIRSQCQAKHLRLRTYCNEVWHLIDNLFVTFNI